MNLFLLYLSNSIILLAFAIYILLFLINQKKNITTSDGFNITKDILHEYDSINIIENKGYFTVYNIKRRVIKIASSNYYGNTLSNIVIPLIESGISAIDNYKNKYLNFFRNLIPNLKCLYLLPIIAIMINSMTYNYSDAKVSIIMIGIFSIIQYLYISIKEESTNWLRLNIKKIKEIKKENQTSIINYINNINLLDKLILISEFIMIIRYIAIIINH